MAMPLDQTRDENPLMANQPPHPKYADVRISVRVAIESEVAKDK